MKLRYIILKIQHSGKKQGSLENCGHNYKDQSTKLFPIVPDDATKDAKPEGLYKIWFRTINKVELTELCHNYMAIIVKNELIINMGNKSTQLKKNWKISNRTQENLKVKIKETNSRRKIKTNYLCKYRKLIWQVTVMQMTSMRKIHEIYFKIYRKWMENHSWIKRKPI